MAGLTDRTGILYWLLATAIAVLTTFVLVYTGSDSTAAGMVFLVLVVWTATRTGFRLAIYTAALCALSFDYFFLIPYHTLRIHGLQQWVAMGCFAASCAVVGRLAEQARRQARSAEQRREDVERLYSLTQEMMLHQDAVGLARNLPEILSRIFALEKVVLWVRDEDQFYATSDDLPMSIHASLRALTEGRNPTLVIPGGFNAMPLLLGLRAVGALGWQPQGLSREVATAVSAQVAIGLTRVIAIEASARMEATREGERLRSALIDSLTHELRTPLTSIRAAATTLLHGEGLEEAVRQDMAALIDEEAFRLDALIGQAVEMAEIDARVIQVRPEPLQPRVLLDQAIEESRKALATHRICVEVEGADIPAWFDPHLLARVLRHLLENAARYSPSETRITLRIRRATGRLEFSVEDNGPGIDPQDLPFIFEKFYRGKNRTQAAKGSGMGLAIARAILAAHGGGIEAQSTVGKGTIFRFWIPLVEKEQGARV